MNFKSYKKRKTN